MHNFKPEHPDTQVNSSIEIGLQAEIDNLQQQLAHNDDFLNALEDEHRRELRAYDQTLWRILERNRDVFMLDMVGRNDAVPILEMLLNELAMHRRTTDAGREGVSHD